MSDQIIEHLENELAEMERKKQQLLSRIGNIEYNQQIIREQLKEAKSEQC